MFATQHNRNSLVMLTSPGFYYELVHSELYSYVVTAGLDALLVLPLEDNQAT